MQYFLIIDDKQTGPYTLEQLKEMAVDPLTPVWCAGMDDWQPAGSINEIAAILPAPEIPEIPQPVLPDIPVQQFQTGADNVNAPAAAPGVIYAPADSIPPGYVAIAPAPGKKPSTHLVLAIVSTVLFFLPLGICAIISSLKVKKHLRNNDMAKAMKMSDRTALFVILSFVLCLIWLPFSVVLSMF